MQDDARTRDSVMAPGRAWYDWTCLDDDLLAEAAALEIPELLALANDKLVIRIFDTREDFFSAEALEYVNSWSQATSDNPTGICGPIGPTEQLRIVAEIINDLNIDVRDGHFWGMDEWYQNGEAVPVTHPLSFERADREMCFNLIRPELRMPDEHLHFPSAQVGSYINSWHDGVACKKTQGGQGRTKHWAFNDPPIREEPYLINPPTPEEYLSLPSRIVELHPDTLSQNAKSSGGGRLRDVPMQAITVGPTETWLSEEVSIWHPGWHDDALGIRLTALMISKGIASSMVPMSLMALHPGRVTFNYLREGIGTCNPDGMH